MYYSPNELYHFGVKGMKWGVRRDKKQYGNVRESSTYKSRSGSTINYTSVQKQADLKAYGRKGQIRLEKKLDSGRYETRDEVRSKLNKQKATKAISISLGVIAASLYLPAEAIAGFPNAKKGAKCVKNIVNGIGRNMAAKKFINKHIVGNEDAIDATEYLLKQYLKK